MLDFPFPDRVEDAARLRNIQRQYLAAANGMRGDLLASRGECAPAAACYAAGRGPGGGHGGC